jgi:hypothetical protein
MPTVRLITLDTADKPRLIAAIRQRNPTASEAFLGRFPVHQLRHYLARLHGTRGTASGPGWLQEQLQHLARPAATGFTTRRREKPNLQRAA